MIFSFQPSWAKQFYSVRFS